MKITSIEKPGHDGSQIREVSMHSIDLSDIEAGIFNLKRAARLAQLQLHIAIGELQYDASGNCIEPPDAENADLAVSAVDQVFDLAEKLERLHAELRRSRAL